MKKPARNLALFVAALLAVACADATAPAPDRLQQRAPEQSALLGGLLDGLLGDGGIVGQLVDALLPPVNRNVPLASDISWSFWAGPAGATSYNSALGLTIAIPRGALATTQRITVTALKGSAVAYKFEPHGLVFSRKVYLTQSLRGTTAGGLLSLPLLSGAYFATDRLELNDDGLAVVSEVLPAVTSLLTKTVTFPIGHFSGYIVASGRSTGGEEESDGR